MKPGKPYGLSPKALLTDSRGLHLVIQRSSESTYWPGKWDLPGGKQDLGETFEETLIREAREETGLEISLTGFIGASVFELPRVNVVFLVMRAEVTGGEFTLSEEHESHRWVTLNELKSLPMVEPIAEALYGWLWR